MMCMCILPSPPLQFNSCCGRTATHIDTKFPSPKRSCSNSCAQIAQRGGNTGCAVLLVSGFISSKPPTLACLQPTANVPRHDLCLSALQSLTLVQLAPSVILGGSAPSPFAVPLTK